MSLKQPRFEPYSLPLYDPNLVMANQTNRQQEVESRVLQLLEFSNLAENLRSDTELAKKMIKAKIQIAFDDAQTNLKRLEDKIFSQIENQLMNSGMNKSLRNIEYDINQLIGKLTSMPALNDKDHEFMMSHIDASIKQVEKNYTVLENYKRAELEKFIDGSGGRQDVNTLIRQQVDKINKFLEAENLNLNSQMILKPKSNESKASDDAYREWLLKPKQEDDNSGENKPIQKENRTGSFEFLDLEKELDLIDVIDKFDDEENKVEEGLQSNGIYVRDDGVSRIFYEIFNKPTEYWLLRAITTTNCTN